MVWFCIECGQYYSAKTADVFELSKQQHRCPSTIIGDDGDRELLCEHGIGHSPNMHTCDGCCFRLPLSLMGAK